MKRSFIRSLIGAVFNPPALLVFGIFYTIIYFSVVKIFLDLFGRIIYEYQDIYRQTLIAFIYMVPPGFIVFKIDPDRYKDLLFCWIDENKKPHNFYYSWSFRLWHVYLHMQKRFITFKRTVGVSFDYPIRLRFGHKQAEVKGLLFSVKMKADQLYVKFSNQDHLNDFLLGLSKKMLEQADICQRSVLRDIRAGNMREHIEEEIRSQLGIFRKGSQIELVKINLEINNFKPNTRIS
ncbi:hypothetical protein GF382_02020 [Candidatus Falkowbacteria bacterium]|nr:hypothetical protein [Candidatus Falkowbacteria bacterium]